MTLQEAFTKMAEDGELARRFTEDPEGVLIELDVDPTTVTIQPIPGGNAPFENFKQAVEKMETEERPTVCTSVGYIACVSSGG